MPEGDTIWRTAARLKPALEGKTIARFEAPRVAGAMPKPGWVVRQVEARGKYLLVHLASGESVDGNAKDDTGRTLTLETHMVMTGSWHIYRSGERWRKSARSVRALIETTEGWQAVCFGAPHVVLRAPNGGSTPLGSDHLGPDLCSPDPDLEAAVAAFGRHAPPDVPIAVALLDQRICCGVGNVYKSEVLHACRLAPGTPVSAVSVERRRELVDTAHRLLRANLGPGRRITTSDTSVGLAVYGRAGEACPRCGGVIARVVQGEHARSTYWCPGCQLVPGVTSPDS